MRLVTMIAGALLLALSAHLVMTELRPGALTDLPAALSAIPAWRAALAFGFVACSYAWLGLYDRLGLASANVHVPGAEVARTSFIAYALANNLGFHALTSNAVRARRYGRFGLGAVELARVAVTTSSTMWLGLLTVAGASLLAAPAGVLPVAPAVETAIGGGLLLLVAGYLAASTMRLPPLRVRGLSWSLPLPAFAAAQVLVGAVDWVLTPLVLWALLPSGVDLATVIVAVACAEVIALASHVPGGAGVLEGALFALLGPRVEHAGLVAGVLLFRALYYLLPFLGASALVASEQIAKRRRVIVRAASFVVPLVPVLGAALVFAAGVVLLVSGATPAIAERVEAVATFVPLSLIEVSHLIGSIVGLGLLILANALRRRLDAAWWVAQALLWGGALASLLKGLDVEEAAFLATAALILVACRRAFDRRGLLHREILTWPWLVASGIAVASAAWIGMFSFEHVQYRGDLWWTFATDADAPRFLRATMVVAVVGVLLAAWRLLSPALPHITPMSDEDRALMARILAEHGHEAAHQVGFLGDKQVLFDDARSAFLLYGVTGRMFVALFDPVGPADGQVAVVRKLRALADQHGGSAAFYEVSAATLPLYLDEGMTLRKFGEEATVELSAFTLDGRARKGLRQARSRAQREGLVFEVIDGRERDALLPELRRVSDEWLRSKHAHEKAFSLGAFDERYLRHFPIAVMRARKDGDRIVAFANVWATASREELSIDLMRFVSDAPTSTMEVLIVELMLWGQSNGFERFALGMAPLAGIAAHRLSPMWSWAASIAFRFGERFYGFRGLRAFKDKFDPGWQPRYVAVANDRSLPGVFAALAVLTSGSLVRVFLK